MRCRLIYELISNALVKEVSVKNAGTVISVSIKGDEMNLDCRASFRLIFLMLLIWTVSIPILRAQQPLPAEIVGLFPDNVINPSGSFIKTPIMNIDISGDVPNTRACDRGITAGTGGMRIELHFFSGPRAALIRPYVKNLPNLIAQAKASLIPAPVHEENIGGETALWVEENGSCAQSQNQKSHRVTLECQFVRGEIYGKIGISFLGDVAEAKDMLAKTLDKISKTNWPK
jgi:hypothetical protein